MGCNYLSVPYSGMSNKAGMGDYTSFNVWMYWPNHAINVVDVYLSSSKSPRIMF